jgi:predicted nucleotide-binding protein
VIESALSTFAQETNGEAGHADILTLSRGSDSLGFDSLHEFIAEYDQGCDYAHVWVGHGTHLAYEFEVVVRGRDTSVEVKADRPQIARVLNVFTAAAPGAALAPEPEPEIEPVVFIGHGGSAQWRDLKDHLHELHGYVVEAYETGARAGHAIRDILESMLTSSSFAILVMTAEDEQRDGTMRARQNVVHEVGLFQGKLGFARAIVLLEEGTEEFSNIHGLNQIRYSKGNIRETYGDVLATLRREFGRA